MLTANNVAGRIQSRVADNNLARANADSQFGSGSALASAALNNCFANRFWFGGFGLWEDAGRRGFDNGYKYKSGGFITGYDRAFGAVTVGGSFAYTAGSYEDKNALSSDSSIDIKGRENARHPWNIDEGATYYAGRFDVGGSTTTTPTASWVR